jgi:hypothetical protein|tara:strand:- start:46 stop:495 length:450 start_codon:yes stop_codon:yes gene_type:complete
MDRPRYVVVEIPDGSLRVGLDESVEPPSPTEDPEIQVDTQRFVKVNDTCKLFSVVNMVVVIVSFGGEPGIIGLVNVIVSIYSAMISNAEVNISIHGKITVYLPISTAILYSACMMVYHMVNFKWFQYSYYVIWFTMSNASLITLEYTVR